MADTESNDGRLPRTRTGSALPLKTPNWAGNRHLSVMSSVPEPLQDNTPTYRQRLQMFYAIEIFLRGNFEARSKPWKYNKYTLLSSAGTPDGLNTWQLLFHQSYGITTLAETGLFSRVSSSLYRLSQSIHEAAKHSSPVMLVYFWKVCVTLMGVPLSGTLKQKNSPAFPMLLMFVEHARASFCQSHQGSHPLVDFLTALHSVLKEPGYCHEIKTILGRTYEKAIEILKDTIGCNHPAVLSMLSHYNKHWKSKLDLQAYMATYSEQYHHLISTAATGDQQISLLYDYAYAMSLGDEINYRVVEELRQASAEICRSQVPLKCTLTSRAFAFTSEMLAKKRIDRDRQQSLKCMDEAIELLSGGDQECCIWAASLSKKLELWYKRSPNTDDRDKVTIERKRKSDIRAKIEENRPAVVASRPTIEVMYDFTLRSKQRVRIRRSEARKEVLSTTLVEFGIENPARIHTVVGTIEGAKSSRTEAKTTGGHVSLRAGRYENFGN
jgi:hypothetical protein